MLNIALPKGRLGEKVYDIFEKSGYECPAIHEKNRKLLFENPEKGICYFWVKPLDVAIYVERGAAISALRARISCSNTSRRSMSFSISAWVNA